MTATCASRYIRECQAPRVCVYHSTIPRELDPQSLYQRGRVAAWTDARLMLASGSQEGLPTPEVLRRVCLEEKRRKVAGFKYKFKCSSARARRLLKLLREQQLGRVRARGRGRIRLALF